MNKEKEKYIDWFEESNKKLNDLYINQKNEYDSFTDDSNQKLYNLEQTYSEKLKVEEPSKFLKEKSYEYRKKAIHWSLATMFLSALLLLLLGIVIDPKIQINGKIISINLFSNELPIYSSIIILSMICLIIYVIRIFVKMTISSKHLSEEYYQKYILTYFYLSLVNNGKIDDELGNLILSTLFSKAETGLIKSNGNNDNESIIKMLTSYNK